jgi:hypothetical protein
MLTGRDLYRQIRARTRLLSSPTASDQSLLGNPVKAVASATPSAVAPKMPKTGCGQFAYATRTVCWCSIFLSSQDALSAYLPLCNGLADNKAGSLCNIYVLASAGLLHPSSPSVHHLASHFTSPIFPSCRARWTWVVLFIHRARGICCIFHHNTNVQ